MKLPLPMVLTFIFISQLHHRESKVVASLFSNTRNPTFEFGIRTLKNRATPWSLDQSLEQRNSEEYISAISYILVNVLVDSINQIVIPDDTEPKTDMECEYSELKEDPIIHMSSMTTPQLIALHGYPVESHTIVTDDGYILTVHRIPFSKIPIEKVSPKKTVLLHHGLFGSSVHWILAGPMKSLGYILSDAGYDVWLANVRGNTYSRAHISKNPDSRAFWDFTFHEVSQHDLPAVIDYITKLKGSDVKINYIGHSMGTTVLFALLSTKPEYNNVLRAGFALAPVAYMTNIISPLRKLAKYSNKIECILNLLGGGKVLLPQNPVLKWLSIYSHELMNSNEERIFENAMTVLLGHDKQQFNKTLIPLILGQGAVGASTKTLVHYAQEIKHSGKFQMFDYGPVGNLKQYGTWSPPEYPLHKITLPIALFSSENNWLSSVIDVTRLQEQIVNPIEHYIVPLKAFNHGYFLWAIDAPTLVYARVLHLLGDGVSDPVSSVNVLNNNLTSTELPNNFINDNIVTN